MGLVEEIARVRAGEGLVAARSMVGELRRSVVLLPLSASGVPLTVTQGGVRWLLAFSGVEPLVRYGRARGWLVEEEWAFEEVLGARVLDGLIPLLDGPTGVVVDVAERERAMVFPPVVGIVPEAVAVDAGEIDLQGGGHGVPAPGVR